MRTGRASRVLVIDNYDSFTWNLVQYVSELADEVRVLRNDRVDLAGVEALAPSHLLLSPGPKGPAEAGICLELIRAFAGRVPLLGVCLGHQCINEAFGGRTVRAGSPTHGKLSRVHTDGRGLFAGLPASFSVCRYHSLVADPAQLGAGLEVGAWSEDGAIMALRHRSLPVEGLQFHPEAFRTEQGFALLRAFFAPGSPADRRVPASRVGPARPRPSPPRDEATRLPFGPEGFWRAVAQLQAEPGFVLLASTLPDPRLGRWSIACFEPEEILSARGRRLRVEAGGRVEELEGEPLALVAERARARPRVEAGPFPFAGGYAGYLGYELGRGLELPGPGLPTGAQLPDLWLGLYRKLLLLEHGSGEVHLLSPSPEDRARIEALASRAPSPPPAWAPREVEADVSPAGHAAGVARIKDWIRAGDVYQVNLTQRLHAPIGDREPWAAFEALARVNPAPFAAFLRFAEGCVASASPERFLELRQGRVETRPIKGTAPRGRSPEEDARRLAELRASEKDLAELTMIVDLMRNDLGRVCEVGSVRVEAFPEAESYASVHHLVATITGELAPGRDAWDLLAATLPGGSITGAPKIRAMEIIDELERARRGVYTGCIGYVGLDGACDWNIAIRSVIFADGRLHLHGGGGVVLDSSEEGEYRESMLKLQKLLEALRLRAPG